VTNALPGVRDGEWYSCLTPALAAERQAARAAVHEHSHGVRSDDMTLIVVRRLEGRAGNETATGTSTST